MLVRAGMLLTLARIQSATPLSAHHAAPGKAGPLPLIIADPVASLASAAGGMR